MPAAPLERAVEAEPTCREATAPVEEVAAEAAAAVEEHKQGNQKQNVRMRGGAIRNAKRSRAMTLGEAEVAMVHHWRVSLQPETSQQLQERRPAGSQSIVGRQGRLQVRRVDRTYIAVGLSGEDHVHCALVLRGLFHLIGCIRHSDTSCFTGLTEV